MYKVAFSQCIHGRASLRASFGFNSDITKSCRNEKLGCVRVASSVNRVVTVSPIDCSVISYRYVFVGSCHVPSCLSDSLIHSFQFLFKQFWSDWLGIQKLFYYHY